MAGLPTPLPTLIQVLLTANHNLLLSLSNAIPTFASAFPTRIAGEPEFSTVYDAPVVDLHYKVYQS